MNHPFCSRSLFFATFVQALLAPPYLWGGQDTLSLAEVTQRALVRNPSVAAARARWRMAMQRIPQEAAWEDPKLNFRSLLGRFVQIPANGFTDQTVSLEQSIPISGKNRSRERAAAAEAAAAFQELRQQELEVVAKARSAFIQLANDYQLLELNQAEEAALSQIIDSSRIKFEVGAQPESDLLTAEVERQKVTEDRQDLERKRSDDVTALQVLMSVDAFGSFGRPDFREPHAVDLDPRELRSRILLNNPVVLQANANLAAANSRYQLAKREWIPDPTVSIQADHYNAGSQIVSEVSGGISISLPWLNEKKYSAGEREAQDQVTAAHDDLENTKNQVLGKLKDQLQKLQTLRHHTALYEGSLIPSAKQNVSANRSDYEADKTPFRNVLSSQRGLWEIEAVYRQHLAEYQIALAELESLVGSNLGFFGSGTEGVSK
jgi:cobalt-zinc-cadmium efflux system outer membrane protein